MSKHDSEDLDSSVFAGHHSLGPRANQAASGNHKHDSLYVPLYDDIYVGSEQPINGGTPPLGTRKFTREGTAVVTTDATGAATVTFPAAFLNGVVSVVAVSGDGNAYNGPITIQGVTINNFVVRKNVATASTIRINYIAIGW